MVFDLGTRELFLENDVAHEEDEVENIIFWPDILYTSHLSDGCGQVMSEAARLGWCFFLGPKMYLLNSDPLRLVVWGVFSGHYTSYMPIWTVWIQMCF